MERKSKPEPAVRNSPGLQALCQRLQSVAPPGILELGPVRSGNIDFWSQFSPSIYVADLRSILPLPVLSSEEAEFVEPDWDHLLGLPENRSYDVILVWDLFNYLDLPAVASLITYLKRFCRPGTVLFSLIFDQKEMPEKITIYGIADDSHLKYEYAGSGVRVCPRHQPRVLAGMMTGFRTAESFWLRNGIFELLFEYRGDV